MFRGSEVTESSSKSRFPATICRAPLIKAVVVETSRLFLGRNKKRKGQRGSYLFLCSSLVSGRLLPRSSESSSLTPALLPGGENGRERSLLFAAEVVNVRREEQRLRVSAASGGGFLLSVEGWNRLQLLEVCRCLFVCLWI